MAQCHALGDLEILRLEYDIDYYYGIFTNLFCLYDRFDIHCGHVIPLLIEKPPPASSRGESTLAQVVAVINLFYQPRLNIVWNAAAPIGVAKRSVDISRLRALGYTSTSNLNDAITQTINWHRQNRDRIHK